jgi:hypothetical protein
MAVGTILQALANKMMTVAPPAGQSAPVLAQPNFTEQINPGDFPLFILYQTPQVENTFYAAANTVNQYDYYVTILLFLGIRNTGLTELQKRCQDWPIAVFRVLATDITLGGLCRSLGEDDSSQFMKVQIGDIKWSDGDYYGVKFVVPVAELLNDIVTL